MNPVEQFFALIVTIERELPAAHAVSGPCTYRRHPASSVARSLRARLDGKLDTPQGIIFVTVTVIVAREITAHSLRAQQKIGDEGARLVPGGR